MDGWRTSPWYEKMLILVVIGIAFVVTWPFRRAHRFWRKLRGG